LCQTAHSAGDAGGEFISVEQLSSDVFNYDTKWHIPTDDLLEIFRRMGRNVPLETFNKCATLFYLESTAISYLGNICNISGGYAKDVIDDSS
jgi:hypothetical protein